LNFHRTTIYNVVANLKKEEFGELNKDAKNFIKMLELDSQKRGGFYTVKLDGNKFQGNCYMTKRMKSLLTYFSDVIIVNVSHSTNRFNLPFLDIVVINNYGQTCFSYFSLLPNQQYSSFQWSLQNFKSQLTHNTQSNTK